MSTERLSFSAEKLGRALDRLDEVLALPGDGLAVDAAIQRFEFTFELLWKTLKRALEEAGRRPSGSPRDVLSFGWRDDWLDGDEQLWIHMLADRNRTSHLYDEALARQVYARIRDYAPPMRRAYDDLCRRFGLPRAAPKGPSTARETTAPYRKRELPGRGATLARAKRGPSAPAPGPRKHGPTANSQPPGKQPTANGQKR